MKLDALRERLNRPVDAATLVTFRILFGALMAGDAFYKYYGDIPRHYAPGKFHFTYPLFAWVEPWPGPGMQLHVIVMGLAALGVMLGLYYRLAAVIYFLTYTYIFLIEQARFNNHYYLIILLAFLFILVDANANASMDKLRGVTPSRTTVPFWNVAIFRAQIFIVYFYGGLAKLNADWLHGEPVRHWLANRANYPVVGGFFEEEWCVYFFTYGGLLFDLLIGFMLLWRRTRLIALVPLVFFHATNGWIFNIGVFPILALAATVLFFEPDTPRRWLSWIGIDVHKTDGAQAASGAPTHRLMTALLVAFFAVQCLAPFRHYLYTGDVNWNEAGHKFAWHMKLRDKDGRGTFRVIDSKTGEITVMGPDEQRIQLTPTQRRKMLTRPNMVLQYAHFLRDNMEALGTNAPQVFANVEVSLNGRAHRPFIDPEVDLARAEYRLFRTQSWVMPLEPGLPIGIYPED